MKIHFVSQFHSWKTGIQRQSEILIRNFKKLPDISAVIPYTWETVYEPEYFENLGLVYPQKYLLARELSTEDIIFYFGEYWSFNSKLYNFLEVPIIWYAPIDSPVLPRDFWKRAYLPDIIVPLSQFGFNILTDNVKNIWKPIPHVVSVAAEKSSNKLKENKDSIKIGTVIRPQRRKNLSALCQIISKLQEKYDLILYVVSENELGEIALTDIFDQFNLSYKIFSNILPFELRTFYDALDIYISTSMSEGFNLPLCEALFMNKCVLATDHPIHREHGLTSGNLAQTKKDVLLPNGAIWRLVDEKDFIEKFVKLEKQNFPKAESLVYSYSVNNIILKWKEFFENLKVFMEYI